MRRNLKNGWETFELRNTLGLKKLGNNEDNWNERE